MASFVTANTPVESSRCGLGFWQVGYACINARATPGESQMEPNRFDVWTRRRFGRMAGGMATLLLGLGTLDDAKASKGKGGKNKGQEPVCKSNAQCKGGCRECVNGACEPKLPRLCGVCEEWQCKKDKEVCVPRRCANGQVCCQGKCEEPCTNGCTRNPTTCICESYCLRTDSCTSPTCGDGQYYDQADCECKCGADKVMCGGTCVSDVCESPYYFDQNTCTCACLNGGARCPTDDPRGACCYPTYVCYESTCYPPG
jgi:hypothetical protein